MVDAIPRRFALSRCVVLTSKSTSSEIDYPSSTRSCSRCSFRAAPTSFHIRSASAVVPLSSILQLNLFQSVLLSLLQGIGVTDAQVKAEIEALPTDARPWAFFMCAGGHFAAAIVAQGKGKACDRTITFKMNAQRSSSGVPFSRLLV